jgi:hypothetical protein
MFPLQHRFAGTRSRFVATLALIAITCAAARPLIAHETVVELPKLLQNGVPQQALDAERSAIRVFRLVIPIGARNLTFETSGGTGDCDLFARFGAHPSINNYDDSSAGPSTNERTFIGRPQAGVWYAKLIAARAYHDVQLTAHYERSKDTDDVPKLLPGPGVFAGKVRVQIKSRLVTGVVRFTIDGSDPTPDSPTYSKPLKFFADTELRVQIFEGKNARGPVVVAPYFVTAPDAVTLLRNGGVEQHRAGMAASEAFFKIIVPEGMERLHVLTRSGVGNIAVLLRHGAPPTLELRDFKQVGVGTRSDLDVDHPAAGEWFIMLVGRTEYSGVSLQASYRGPKPDLIAWPGVLDPYETIETFMPEDCEVQENMITAGTHRLLRFSTESRNIGGADLVLGDPMGNPNFEFQECHGHYHFKGFASYVLRAGDGSLAAEGRKVSFCLEDVSRWDPAAPARNRYDCEMQGIRVGWSDIYDSGLPGQWIDITDVPDGDYNLEITINPDLLLEEADYSNNTSIVPVTIGP